MNYVKMHWDESRGDEFDAWGTCTYLFEFDDNSIVSRQIEVYESGNSLKYDLTNFFDKYGMLTDQPITLEEAPYTNISDTDFESEWEKAGYVNGEKQWLE